ncbi:MAG: pentapeptide repeat-containing protein [Ignavibacteria bacterium]|nr:pentapeptide repeat-containing protein [Ignavibacteria bacterium]
MQFSSSSIGEKSILNNSKFVSANFFNSSFSSSSLERVSFTDAFLNGVFFESCQMPYVSFKKLMLLNVINDFTMNKVNFSNGSMIKYDASSSNLVNSNFTNANFSYTNLSGAEINGSTFNNTNLDFANLCGVTGKPAVFRDVSQAGTKCPIKP